MNMKTFGIPVWILFAVMFLSCDRNTDDVADVLTGCWIKPVHEAPYWKYEKAQALTENRPGVSFGPQNQYIERRNISMIEEFQCVDYSGEWKRNDSMLSISWGYNDPYNSPKADYQWKIISVDEKYLTIEKTEEKYQPGFSPTDVFVKTKNHYTVDRVFEFINSLDHDVEYIYNGVYRSNMPSDQLQYILDRLNEKPYTHREGWNVTGYLHHQTQQITVFPRLFDMKNKAYQSDWLKSMNDFQLIEEPGYIIFLHVPEGTEKEWVERFKSYDFVDWAELSIYVGGM
jgi:hypothetical protein